MAFVCHRSVQVLKHIILLFNSVIVLSQIAPGTLNKNLNKETMGGVMGKGRVRTFPRKLTEKISRGKKKST